MTTESDPLLESLRKALGLDGADAENGPKAGAAPVARPSRPREGLRSGALPNSDHEPTDPMLELLERAGLT
jgi:hypothetical protein